MQTSSDNLRLRATRAALTCVLAALLGAAACSEQPGESPSAPAADAPTPQSADAPAPSSDAPERAPSCDIPECFRAVECVAKCGGPVLSSSCCPCPEGQLDQLVECPPPHAPVCDPGCQPVCENGMCNCECGEPSESPAPPTL